MLELTVFDRAVLNILEYKSNSMKCPTLYNHFVLINTGDIIFVLKY